MSEAKIHIGVLTSGGDCPGLNAAIRAVVLRAVDHYGWKVTGICNGTNGLFARPVDKVDLSPAIFDGTFLRRAGTMLGSVNFGDPTKMTMPDGTIKDRSAEIAEGYNELGLDALIAIGGDGSLEILDRIGRKGGWNWVGIPKTIDNDVAETDATIGFDTAVFVAVEALDRLQPTAASHDRLMILEVMGRDAGHIALHAGVAGGADVILMPEAPFSLQRITERVEEIRAGGRDFVMIVVAEGVSGIPDQAETGPGPALARALGATTGMPPRVTVLGHVQRGAEPTPRDRMLASAFGVHAVDLVAREEFGRVVAWRNREVSDFPLSVISGRTQKVSLDSGMVKTAAGLGIYLGDFEISP